MTKTFASRPLRQPRGIESHPAHARAAAAFSPEALQAAAKAAAPETGEKKKRTIKVASPYTVPGRSVRIHRDAAVTAHAARSPKPKPVLQPTVPKTQKAPPAPKKVTPTVAAVSSGARVKQSAFASVAACQRLRTIKRTYRKAESFVGEFALASYFEHFSNDEIEARLQGLGHGLRRGKDSPPVGPGLTLYITDEQRRRLEDLYDNHRVGASIVAGDAIEWLLAKETDERIVNELSQKGLGLKRSRAGA